MSFGLAGQKGEHSDKKIMHVLLSVQNVNYQVIFLSDNKAMTNVRAIAKYIG